MSLFDHVSLVVRDFARSKAFYDRALAPLGVKVMEAEKTCGYGREEVDFWIGEGPASFQQPEQLRAITPVHIALAARSRARVTTCDRRHPSTAPLMAARCAER
jgi:catechol 2,3-dioxygenase-like lactoylglutathione lyase family enzyme